MSYNPADWYWIVGASTSNVYSSASGSYIPINDTSYKNWLNDNKPTRIDTEQSLTDVLVQVGLSPVASTPNPSDYIIDGQYSSIPDLLRKWMLDVDNRVRVLEGQSVRTKTQFRQYVKSL